MRRQIRSIATVATLALVVLPVASRRAQYVRHDNDPFGGKPAPIAPVSVAKAILDRNDRRSRSTDSQRTQLAAHPGAARLGERAAACSEARRGAPDAGVPPVGWAT